MLGIDLHFGKAGERGSGRALVVLDRNHQIVSSNPLAESILTEAEGLRRRGGELALFLSRPGPEASADPQALRDLLGLTMAEARLATALAEGPTLVEAARRLGIAHNTTKAQLRAVFAKTGVRRQSQLVALLASFAG